MKREIKGTKQHTDGMTFAVEKLIKPRKLNELQHQSIALARKFADTRRKQGSKYRDKWLNIRVPEEEMEIYKFVHDRARQMRVSVSTATRELIKEGMKNVK